MKKYILITTLFASAVAFAQSNYPSTIIGGGDAETGTYFEVIGAKENPSALKIDVSSSESDTIYAGMNGDTISWVFEDVAYSSANDRVAMNVYSNFRVKNALEFHFKGKGGSTTSTDAEGKEVVTKWSSWDHRGFAHFNIYNGAHLIIDDLYVAETAEFNGSRIYFEGKTSKGNATVTFRDNTNKENMLLLGNVNFNYNLTNASNRLLLKSIYMIKDATFNMSSDVTLSGTNYISLGSDSAEIKMGGYDLLVGAFRCESAANVDCKLRISFGNDAEGDGCEFKLGSIQLGNASVNSLKLIFTDFDYTTDKVYIGGNIADDALVFEGYEAYEIQKEFYKTEGSINYYSYYVIPEPADYAIFAGLLALGVAVYRRRK